MIQRIQTIWLLLAAALGFVTLSQSISFFSFNKLVDNVTKLVPFNAKENNLILILIVAVSVAALIDIFLFKNRKMQLRIAIVALIVSILNIVLLILQVKQFAADQRTFDFTAIVYIVIPAFLFLAARAIWKDERMVRSADRLR
jgi:hypothetical protein